MKRQIYRLFKLRQNGKKVKAIDVDSIEIIICNMSIRAWSISLVKDSPSNSNWPIEYWLHDVRINIIDEGIYVRGTEFLEDGETEVVQEWLLVQEGTKEISEDEIGETNDE